eukprot:15468515-Alexandrium_andersonii.AAC.1
MCYLDSVGAVRGGQPRASLVTVCRSRASIGASSVALCATWVARTLALYRHIGGRCSSIVARTDAVGGNT